MTVAASAQAKTNAQYQELLQKLQEIPTLPIVAVRVNELINDPNSTSAQVAEVLRRDQALTAKILRLANSSYYAIPGGVTDVQRALAFLGFNTVAQLVLGISVFSLFTREGDEVFSLPEFWKHTLAVAVCSETLARKLPLGIKPEEAFTCGLLHDIGKLVLHQIDPARFRQILMETKKRQCSFTEVEKEWDLPGHAFLGEAMATQWGLPQVIRLAIHYHHQDVSKLGSVLSSAKPMIQLVRLANSLCVKNRLGQSGDYSDGGLSLELLAPFKLDAVALQEVEKDLAGNMEKAGAFLSAYR